MYLNEYINLNNPWNYENYANNFRLRWICIDSSTMNININEEPHQMLNSITGQTFLIPVPVTTIKNVKSICNAYPQSIIWNLSH